MAPRHRVKQQPNRDVFIPPCHHHVVIIAEPGWELEDPLVSVERKWQDPDDTSRSPGDQQVWRQRRISATRTNEPFRGAECTVAKRPLQKQVPLCGDPQHVREVCCYLVVQGARPASLVHFEASRGSVLRAEPDRPSTQASHAFLPMRCGSI